MRARHVALVCGAALACGRSESSRDTTASRDTSTAAGADWVAELGPTLVIPGDSEQVALEINGPTSGAAPVSVRLGHLGGPFASAIAAEQLAGDSLGCDTPALRLRGSAPSGWTIGVASRDVTSVPLDSMEALSGADSSTLSADVARVASALAPPDSRFRGLPFVALKAYRIRDGSRSTLLATVLRRIPQEATPFEARGFVIGESAGQNPYSLAYGLRSEGTEETVEHFALLAVLRVGTKEFAVLEREQESGTRYEILERSATGGWRVRWSRMLAC